VRAGTEHTERRQRLEQELHERVQSWRLPPGVEALQAWRGVPLPVAVTTGAELGDWTRVEHPRPLRKYPGLLPSPYPSGERRRQGALPKAGHAHARRALVEGAWASRSPAQVSRPPQLRLDKLPNPSQAISWKAQGRRCKRFRRVRARGQHANHVVVAMARELRGFMWASANQLPVTPSPLDDHGPPPGKVTNLPGKRRGPGVGPPATA
jgi:hypothetical protein